MAWIVILLSLLVAAADLRFYRRNRYKVSPLVRKTLFTCAFISDALPILLTLFYVVMPDNPTWAGNVSLWSFFIFTILVVPRMAFYFFHHFKLNVVGVIAAIIVVAIVVWGVTYGRTTFIINKVELSMPRLPQSFDGLRIVQFSDTHIGTLIRPERELKRLVEAINALNPDLVIFSGDLINVRYTELDTMAMCLLSQITAPLGVVSNIGNHDTGVYAHDTITLPVAVNTARLIERQQQMGWRVLDNQSEYIVRGDDSISISAISFDPTFRKARHDRTLDIDLSSIYEGVPSELCNITISHLPQLWEQITELGYGDLTVAGHVHAMQISINIGKHRFSPAQLFYDQWSGLYESNEKYLYINDGTGYVGFPMRLGAYPEITLFTLKR